MRIIFLIIIILFFSKPGLAQTGLEAKVDFNASNVTTAEALILLSEQTKFEIAFSDHFFQNNLNSFSFYQQSIEFVLKEILKKSGIDYKLLGDQLILFKKVTPLPKYTISGYIEDSETGERLIGATIYSKTHKKGTVSNEYGFYSLTLNKGPTELLFNYLGAQSTNKTISLIQNQQLNLGLDPAVVLAEVIVTPFSGSQFQPISESVNSNIDIKQVKIQPDLGGESDIVRAVQLQPGVQTGADGVGGLHVRGGNSDQNLMLLDGVPIYNPSHLMGLLSIYNTSAIRSAKLLKGGFPARYGGRISSVFDVRTREGNHKKWSGEAGLGLISGKATIEGPIANGKGAILLTGRISHSNFLLKSIMRDAFYNGEDGDLKYAFYDINAKVNFTFSQKDKLYLSYYTGGDDFKVKLEEEYVDDDEYEKNETENKLIWGNNIAALRWNHLYNDQLFSNTTLSFSKYNFSNAFLEVLTEEFENEIDETYFFFEYLSDIEDWAIKSDFDYLPSPIHSVRFGFGYVRHHFMPGAFYLDFEDEVEVDSIDISEFSNTYDAPIILTNEFYIYAEDNVRLGTKLKVNFGLRNSAFLEESKIYFYPEPRLRLDYSINPNLLVHTNLSRMVQYLHRVSPSGLSTPDEVWIPSTDIIKPQDAWQTGLGLIYSNDSKIELSAEGYYKKMKNILSFGDIIPDFSVAEELENELIPGYGWGYGLEVMLKKTKGKTGGCLSYTFAKADRKFQDLNGGIKYAYQYDRRHSVSIYFFHHFYKNLIFTANWIYGSSNPQLIVAESEFINTIVPINTEEGKKNTVRTDNYHRLDLSLSYILKKRKIEHQLKVNLYNAYNRKNPVFHRRVQLQNQQFSNQPVNLLPIIPSFSYQITF